MNFNVYPSQFSSALSKSNPLISGQSPLKIPVAATIQANSSSQFSKINCEIPIQNQRTPPISVTLPHQIPLKNPAQQAKPIKQSKQLTIQQSIQQMSQPVQNQQQLQYQAIVRNTMQQQIQSQPLQNPNQNSIMPSSIHIPAQQQPFQQQHQADQLHQLPLSQQQIIRPINTPSNSIQIPQDHFQVQPNNIIANQSHILSQQVQQQINPSNKILNSPTNQNLTPDINQSINQDSNLHVRNILQQFVPQISPDPSLTFDDEFQVEGIADEREVKGKKQYLVQWAGFSDDENTWEEESNLTRYYQLINDFRMNGPKPRTQRRVVDFISGFVSNGKIHYNLLYQNDEVATLTSLQARGSRVKQQLINFLEKEYKFPEKERAVFPKQPPKPSKSLSISPDDQKNDKSDYDYELVEEEEEIENGDISGADGESKKIKKKIKKRKRCDVMSIDDVGSVASADSKDDIISEEMKMQQKILQDDPIENSNIDEM